MRIFAAALKIFPVLIKQHLRVDFIPLNAHTTGEEKTWHPHVHVLFDASYAYPIRGMKHEVLCESCRSKGKRGKGSQRVGLSADCTCPFFIAKVLLEYSWLRITSPDAGRLYRRNSFESWKRDMFAYADDVEWNKRFRRVVDVRVVKGDDGSLRGNQVRFKDKSIPRHSRRGRDSFCRQFAECG